MAPAAATSNSCAAGDRLYVLDVFAGNGTTTGAYSLKVWSVPTPDTFDVALAAPKAALHIPADVTGSGTPGKLDSPGAKDTYRFTTATSGQRVYLDYVSADPGMYWRLYGPDGDEYVGLFNGLGEHGSSICARPGSTHS